MRVRHCLHRLQRDLQFSLGGCYHVSAKRVFELHLWENRIDFGGSKNPQLALGVEGVNRILVVEDVNELRDRGLVKNLVELL